jgi:hypothetical protein
MQVDIEVASNQNIPTAHIADMSKKMGVIIVVAPRVCNSVGEINVNDMQTRRPAYAVEFNGTSHRVFITRKTPEPTGNEGTAKDVRYRVLTNVCAYRRPNSNWSQRKERQ